MKPSLRGFTIIELMVALAVVAILASIAVPSFRDFFDKYRLKSAAEALYGDVQFARSEAVRRNVWVSFNVSTGTDWCYAVGTVTSATATATCSCSDTNDATCIKIRKSTENAADYPNITLSAGATLRFEPTNGRLIDSGTGQDTAVQSQTFASSQSSRQVRVRVTPLGIPSLCSVSGLTEYAACP